jgi:putative glutamine amidotransferase
MRPLIGLSTYREQAAWGSWDQPADLLPASYAQAIEVAGGVPVLLPATQPYGEAARAVVNRLDGILIAGGADVDPRRYGEEPHPRTTVWREVRDAWEVALLDAADERRLATLGVCRGMQLMAVRAGGALNQHVPDLVGHETHNPGGDRFGDTRIRVAEGSLLAHLVGAGLDVHCHHHQSVKTHPGFVATAWAEDGQLEAMESASSRTGGRFCVAVQWHPEVAHDAGLFRAIVEAASR